MHTWTTFLNTQTLNTCNPEIIQQTVIIDISHLGLIQVEGQDAEKFLQGQFTNDVRQVKPHRSQFSAWCTSQGRVIVNFQLLRRENAYYLLLPANSIPTVLKKLQMFVMRSAVKLSDASETLAKFCVAGERAAQILSDTLHCQLPENIDDCVTAHEFTIVKMRSPTPCYLLLSSPESTIQLWQNLVPVAPPHSQNYWHALTALAGVPWIDSRLTELFVPQMLNLQALSAINFKKGCYSGQEIVARMQYLATLKRRLFLATCDGTSAPQIGEELFEKGVKDKEIGKIINVIAQSDGYLILAVVTIDAVQNQTVTTQAGQPLTWRDLPYPIELKS